jgi:Nucleotidyl transferase AbiEii toxin, Type IV TA system
MVRRAPFQRPEHQAVAAALQAMDHDWLMQSRCWFGGGTEIVLDLGEYRLSKDIDFLCADPDGYRTLRSAAVSQDVTAFFAHDVVLERPFRSDQYGIRAMIRVGHVPIRFEIVREGRIALDGRADPGLGVPRLTEADRVAEKLLANADRCQDLSTHFRDAADLGMLALHRHPLPETAFRKARAAYGDDVPHKLDWALAALADLDRLTETSIALGMDSATLTAAVTALDGEAGRNR